MGAIEDVVKLFTKQKCVYWGNPKSDGKGGYTFDDPIEIDCRWDDKQELKQGYDGNYYSSQAQVLVNIDIKRRSYFINHTMEELITIAEEEELDITNPRNFSDAFIVIQFEKIPMVFANDDFVRTVFLYDQG